MNKFVKFAIVSALALSAPGTSGNMDNGELSAAGRVTYGGGDWNHLIDFAAEYSENQSTTHLAS